MLDDVETPGTEISYAEYLLVRTWRRIVASRGNCPLAGKTFAAVPGGEDVLPLLAAFLKTLGHGSRHVLAVGHPGCFGLTPDERQMLALIAAAQSGDEALLSSHLCWLVRGEYQESVSGAARLLGRLLATHGLDIPAPAPLALPMHPMLCVVKQAPRASLAH